MPIEEAFKLIRNFLDGVIGTYTSQIEEIEELNNFMEKNKFFAVTNHNKWAKTGKVEVNNIFASKEVKALTEKSKQIASENMSKRNACRITRECFGKTRIIKKIVDFEAFFINLNTINYELGNVIERETIAKIIGMAIYTNNSIYEKKKAERDKDFNSSFSLLKKESHAIVALKPYFDSKGNIVANDDVDLFVDSLTTLFTICPNRNIDTEIPLEKNFTVNLLIELMKEQLLNSNRIKVNSTEEVCSTSTTITNYSVSKTEQKEFLDEQKLAKENSIEDGTNSDTMVSKKQRRELMEQQRLNEQELARYFDGEKILIPCDSIEAFINLVNSCNLTKEQKNRIITKMRTFLSKNETLNNIPFLTIEEQEIYKIAIEKQIGNVQIKATLEEINLFLEMYKEETSDDDKIYIENEVKDLIKRLRFILNIDVVSLRLQNE